MSGEEVPSFPICSPAQPVDTNIDRLDLIKTETVIKTEEINDCVEQCESVHKMTNTTAIAQMPGDLSSYPLPQPMDTIIDQLDLSKSETVIKTEEIEDCDEQYESVQIMTNVTAITQKPEELSSSQPVGTIIDRLDLIKQETVVKIEEIDDCVEQYESVQRTHNVIVQSTVKPEEVLDIYLDGIGLPSTSQLLSYSGPPVKCTTNGILLACRRITGDGGWPASRRRLFHLLQLSDIPYHRRLAFEIRKIMSRLYVQAMRLISSGYQVVQNLLMFYDTACKTPLNRLPGLPFYKGSTPLSVFTSHATPSRPVTRVFSVVEGPGSPYHHQAPTSTVSAIQGERSRHVTPAQEGNTSGHAVSRFVEEEVTEEPTELDMNSLLPVKKKKYPWSGNSEIADLNVEREKFQKLFEVETEENAGGDAAILKVEANEADALLHPQQQKVTEQPEKSVEDQDPLIIIDKLKADAIVLQKRAVEAEHELQEMKKLVTVWNTQSRTFTDHCVEHMVRFGQLGVDGQKLPEALECAASFAGVKLDMGQGLLKAMSKRGTPEDKC